MTPFLPDVENGKLKDEQVPTVFTPKERVRPPRFEADGLRPDAKVYTPAGAPTMANMHECEPTIYGRCYKCDRVMTV